MATSRTIRNLRRKYGLKRNMYVQGQSRNFQKNIMRHGVIKDYLKDIFACYTEFISCISFYRYIHLLRVACLENFPYLIPYLSIAETVIGICINVCSLLIILICIEGSCGNKSGTEFLYVLHFIVSMPYTVYMTSSATFSATLKHYFPLIYPLFMANMWELNSYGVEGK